MSASLLELIGREVSLPVAGSRSRRRGHISEITDGGLPLVAFYDSDGREEVEADPKQLRLLSDRIPAGWRGLDVVTEDGTPWISMRVRPDVIALIKQVAREEGLSRDEAFSHIIQTGLELAIARQKREQRLASLEAPDSAVA